MCASSGKDAEHKLFPEGRGFHPFFIEEKGSPYSANAGTEPYCIVFVGLFLRKDARKSAAECFQFADRHCENGKVASDTEGGGSGDAAMKKARSCDLAFRMSWCGWQESNPRPLGS